MMLDAVASQATLLESVEQQKDVNERHAI